MKGQKSNLMNGLRKEIANGEVFYGGRTITLNENKKNNVRLQKTTSASRKDVGGASAGGGGGGIRSVMTRDVKALAAKDFKETKQRRGEWILKVFIYFVAFVFMYHIPFVASRPVPT